MARSSHPQLTTGIAPVLGTFGVEVVGVQAGAILAVQRVLPADVDQDGRLAAGALCVLADASLGLAVCTVLGASQRIVTNTLSLEFARPPSPARLPITGRSSVLDLGPASALATALLTLPGGSLVAQATGRFTLVPHDGTVAAPLQATPDAAAHGSMAFVEHPLTAAAPIHRRLGTRIRSAEGGRVTLEVVIDHAFGNERGGLHGGIGGLVGERGTDLAVASALPPTVSRRLGGLRTTFVRPLPAAGQRVVVRSHVRNVGRTQVLARAEVLTADGKLAIEADAVYTVEAT